MRSFPVTVKDLISFLLLAGVITGCGAAYQAETRIRSHRMLDSLKPGESIPQVRKEWGEPDLVTDQGSNAEIWSYASRANTNDLAATVFYTAAKEGDSGEFIDLRFEDGKLVSWSKQEHTMPAKHQNYGFSLGPNAPNPPEAAHF